VKYGKDLRPRNQGGNSALRGGEGVRTVNPVSDPPWFRTGRGEGRKRLAKENVGKAGEPVVPGGQKLATGLKKIFARELLKDTRLKEKKKKKPGKRERIPHPDAKPVQRGKSHLGCLGERGRRQMPNHSTGRVKKKERCM